MWVMNTRKIKFYSKNVQLYKQTVIAEQDSWDRAGGPVYTQGPIYSSSVIYEYTVRVPNSTPETSRDKKMSVITGIH